MKTALYVATVARTYRKAIDDYLEDPKLYEAHLDWYRSQISNCTYRQFTTDFSTENRRMRHRSMTAILMRKTILIWESSETKMIRDVTASNRETSSVSGKRSRS